MILTFLPSLFFMVAISAAHEIKIYNHCPFTIWPGIQGNPGHGNLENGGFSLAAYQARIIGAPNNWAGRIWGRTNCDNQGKCQTGDCGNKIECNGAGGVPPASLAEMTFTGAGGLDFYDISLVDGYNLPIKMVPTGGFVNSGNGKYDCKAAGCVADLNAICPSELAVQGNGNYNVACKSACARFNTDEYCCRGIHNTPQTCKSSSWPINYPAIFKTACPDAYSYAYDDTTSTFTCRGNPSTNSFIFSASKRDSILFEIKYKQGKKNSSTKKSEHWNDHPYVHRLASWLKGTIVHNPLSCQSLHYTVFLQS